MLNPAERNQETATTALNAAGMVAASDSRVNALEQLAARQAAVLRSLSRLLDSEKPGPGLLALADEIRQRFRCDRVAIAACDRNDQPRLETFSQQADFDRKSANVALFEAATAEAMRLDRIVVCSTRTAVNDPSLSAHRTLLTDSRATELITLPLVCNRRFVGAILLVRTEEKPLSPVMQKLLSQIGALIAPVVDLRLREDESLTRHLRRALRSKVTWLRSGRHLAAKLIAASIALVLLALGLWPATWRIGADAELIPLERRIVSVPFNGFIRAVHVETGATVTAGTPLIALDTAELELERARWNGEVRGASTELRAAMAETDRKEVAVLAARLERAQAQLELAESQLQRAVITAPVNGMVTSDDLSQAIGAPVERGDSLLEIAPDGAWKTVLWVDETDIAYVQPGQSATLQLRANPGEALPLEIITIHPIATAGEGANRFRVEAAIQDAAEKDAAEHIRPGQTGYAKIEVGKTSLLWQWTRRFTDWLANRFWAATG